MAYTIPDYAAFIARFPIFSDTTQYPQPQVETLLVEASGQVDTDWLERDYAPAIMYLTAHMLALDNSGADDAIDIGGPSSISSESFSGMSISYKALTPTAGSSFASSSFGNTVYGRRYYDLLKKNKPAVVVA
jgi:hypothetical protein